MLKRLAKALGVPATEQLERARPLRDLYTESQRSVMRRPAPRGCSGGVLWWNDPAARRAGAHVCSRACIPPGEFSPAQIRVLSPLRRDEEGRVLLHEMYHAATWTEAKVVGAPGPLWRQEMRRPAVARSEAWSAEKAAQYEPRTQRWPGGPSACQSSGR